MVHNEWSPNRNLGLLILVLNSYKIEFLSLNNFTVNIKIIYLNTHHWNKWFVFVGTITDLKICYQISLTKIITNWTNEIKRVL